MVTWKHLFLYFLMVSNLCAAAFAQGVYGGLQGTVTDNVNAVLPGANISVREVTTGIVQTAQTNNDGLFVIANLRPGTYEITVQKDGFAELIRNGVQVRVGDQITLNLSMSIGTVSSTVQVSSEAPLVRTDDTIVGSVIDETTIKQLPLSGRTAFDLALLTPGVQQSSVSNGTGSDNQPRLSGGRSRTNEFTLDGTSITDPRRGSSVISPNLDAIREFAVITNGIPAQYGRLAGGVITSTIKSGTNQYHGNIFEFHRGDGLGVARNYFATTVPHLVYNQFGGIIGGPIVRNKLFFFADYQGTRQRQRAVWNVTVPSALEQQGNFSDILGPSIGADSLGRTVYQNQIFDPATTRMVNGKTVRDPFPNNTIPKDRWDPAAAKIVSLYVIPNRPGLTQNYYSVQPSGQSQDQADIRVDLQLRPEDLFFVRFSVNRVDATASRPYPASLSGGNRGEIDTFYTTAIAWTHTLSSTVVNDFRFGALRGELLRLNTVRPTDTLGIPNVNQTALPSFSLSGYDSIGDSPNFDPTQEQYQLVDNVSLVKGKHILSVGADFRRFRINDLQLTPTTYNFASLQTGNSTQSATGNSFASFLLGAASQYTVDPFRGRFYLRSNYFGTYVQDEYKVFHNFTANIGLRYEIEQNPNEVNYNGSNFDIESGQVITMRQMGRNRIQNTQWSNFGPRIGFAWQPFHDSTVVRGSYGIFYTPLTGRATSAYDRFPASRNYTLQSSSVASAVTISQTPAVPSDSTGYNLNHVYDLPNAHVPYFQQTSIDIQRELSHHFIGYAGYTNSVGRHLYANVQYNQIPIAQVRAAGSGTQAMRPFPNYANIGSFAERQSTSYNALLLQIERRFANGFLIRGAFTWSKFIDEQNDNFSGLFPQDQYNPRAERGLSLSNVPTRTVVSSVYTLPFGTKQRYFNSGFLGQLLGGWQIGGIFSVQSGQQVWIRSANNTSGTFSQMMRPNVVAKPFLSPSERTIRQWFNTAAFQAPAPLTFGNSSKTPNLQGPMWYNLDGNIHREIHLPFTEDTRLELRGECFNCANHANFLPPAGVFGTATFGQITTAQAARTLQVAGKLWF